MLSAHTVSGSALGQHLESLSLHPGPYSEVHEAVPACIFSHARATVVPYTAVADTSPLICLDADASRSPHNSGEYKIQNA